MNFSWDKAEYQIIEVLPELRPAAEIYWEKEGKPGEDCGNYIFFEGIVPDYVEALLAMTESPGRNRLLKRALDMVDDMLTGEDKDIRDLAYIGLFESRGAWFYSRALPFLGLAAIKELAQWEPDWKEALTLNSGPDLEREILDLYSAHEVIFKELQSEGLSRFDIPGNTYPREELEFPSLEIARDSDEGVVFLSRNGTHLPYVVCPAKQVLCEKANLKRLAQDLYEIDDRFPTQVGPLRTLFLRIPVGERVWHMNHGDKQHMRYTGQLWIADIFLEKGLSEPIKGVLEAKAEHI